MGKYAVLYWKTLNKNQVNIREFSDEAEMVEFAEMKKISGFGVIAGEQSQNKIGGEKIFKIRNYGAYVVLKRISIYFGLILIIFGVFVILYLQGKGI